MEGSSQGRGVALAAATTLAVITGYVDAVGFARLLGVFPANQSGNLVFLGMAIGGRGPAPAWRSGTAIVAFAVGVAVAYVAGRRIPARRRGPSLLGVELLLLLAVAFISGPVDHSSHVTPGFEGWVLILLSGVAMGIQTEVIRHVAGIAVATTYETGTLVRVGEFMSRPIGSGRAGPHAKALAVMGSVVAAYVLGAAIGATAVGEWRWPLLLPGGLLLALGFAWLLRPGWFAAVED